MSDSMDPTLGGALHQAISSASMLHQSNLLHEVTADVVKPHAKITVVGVGQVGMACAYSIVMQHISSELALVDVQADKLKGEMLDLQQGAAFARPIKIRASTDYAVTSNSMICIITAGARQRVGESRLDLVQRNVNLYKMIVPQLVKYSPNTILVVVSNPVDILTYATWRISGLPQERVFGSGTNLDSARFRFLLSEKLNIAATSCHGWIIGEHGDSSVAVWSGVNVAGVQLFDAQDKDAPEWTSIHKSVVDSASEIIKLKGYTSWAIGMSIGSICFNIVHNTRVLAALSTTVKGLHGITADVFLSLPVVIGESGVTHIVMQKLTEGETRQLQESALALQKMQNDLHL